MKKIVTTSLLTLTAVALLGLATAAMARAAPMVIDKETGQFKDVSYEALSDEGLSWKQRTRIFGGETATYGELTDEQRTAKKKELEQLLAKIDMDLVNKCDADLRAWFDQQAAKPLKRPGWETNWREDWSIYTKASRGPLASGAVSFFRAYEMWGDEKYLEAALRRADPFVNAQYPNGAYRMKPANVMRVQDGWQSLPWSIVIYAAKHSKDKKYLESAKKCADVLLSVQRADSGGWPDQWAFPGGSPHSSGVIHGTSHNDGATTAQFVMMVIMYHATGDEKYVANLHKLGPHLVKVNLGVGDVVGWAEAYDDGEKPRRVRQYEIEICYPNSLTRSMGYLLTWLYLMDGNEKHMELMKKAYNTLERIRQKDLAPENWKSWKALRDAGGSAAWYRFGFPHAFLPDGSNTGRAVLGYRMHPIYPVTDEQRTKWGHFLHGGPDLHHYAREVQAGKPSPDHFAGGGPGNALCQVRRALLEHKRGGYEGLLKYYTGPTRYTPDQYLQARVDAAQRALDPRNVRLASMHEKGIKSVKDVADLLAGKNRWYGPDKSKWGKAYEDYALRDDGWWEGLGAMHQWQLVYDVMIAQGKLDADAAARGGRGLEHAVGGMNNLDSWDVIGQYDNHAVEVANHFDVPIMGKKK